MDKRTPKFESSNKHNPSNTLNTASKVKKSDVDNLLSNELKEYEGDHSNQMPDVKRKLSYNQEDNEFGSQLFTFRQREEESEKSNENASKENEPNADILNEILSLNEKIIQPTFDKSSTYKEHRDILNKLKKFDFPERRLDSELLKFLKYIEKTITPQQQEKMSEYYQLMNGPLLNITNYDDLEEIKLMKRREEFLEKVHDLEDELETVRKEKKLSLFQEELRMAELRNDEFHHLVNERIIMEKNNLSKAEEIRKNEGRSLILENEIKLKKDLISKIDKLLAENQNKKNILEKRKNDIKKLEGEIKSFQNANNQVTQNIEKIQKDNKALETLIQETEKIKDALAELAQKKEKECRGLQDQADKKENENKNIAELNKANLKKIADLDYEIEIISTYNIEKASEKRKVNHLILLSLLSYFFFRWS